jgi:hypothetical protein
MLDTHGAQTNSFRCADCMQIELEFHLDKPGDRPLIQYLLCNVNGAGLSAPFRAGQVMRLLFDLLRVFSRANGVIELHENADRDSSGPNQLR